MSVTIPALNSEVARFLHQSNFHKTKLENVFSNVASVEVKSCRIGDDDDGDYLFCFTPMQDITLDSSFEDFCRISLLSFLEDYAGHKKVYSLIKTAKAKISVPDLVKDQSLMQNEFLLVKWRNNEVLVAGPKSEVKAKLQEIDDIILNPTNAAYLPTAETSEKQSTTGRINNQSFETGSPITPTKAPLKKIPPVPLPSRKIDTSVSSVTQKSEEQVPRDNPISTNTSFDESEVFQLDDNDLPPPLPEKDYIQEESSIYENVSLRRPDSDPPKPVPKPQRLPKTRSATLSLPPESMSQAQDHAPKRTQSFPTTKTLKDVTYRPRGQMVSLLNFVWSEPRFREALEESLADLCVLSGHVHALKAEPKFNKNCDQSFLNAVFERIEAFLSQTKIINYSLDTDLVEFLHESANKRWLKTLLGSDRSTKVELEENQILIKGYLKEVDAYENKLKKQFAYSSVPERNRDLTRQLVLCECLEELNELFGKDMTLTCSLEDESFTFTGRNCYFKRTMQRLKKLKTYTDTPDLSDTKLKALETFLSYDNRKGYEDYFQSEFSKNEIKCVIRYNLEEGKVLLTAMMKTIWEQGSKCLDDVLLEEKILLPKSLSRNLFEQEPWRDIATLIRASTVVMQVQDDLISLIGFSHTALADSRRKVENFLPQSKITKKIPCDEYESKFILKYLLPASLRASEIPVGLAVKGPSAEVESFSETVSQIEWSRSTLAYEGPGLVNYFLSGQWSQFVKNLEHEVHCITEKKIITSRNRQDSSKAHGPSDDAYGSLGVSVRKGNITTVPCDVILNGVWDDTFNLSASILSSRVLKAAGNELQKECSNQVSASNRFIRTTDGYALPCKHVIHVVTPNDVETLTNRIKQALQRAEQLQASSVAIPTLGAGGVGIEPVGVAMAIFKAIEVFAGTRINYVKTIKVIVFDDSLFELFKTTIAPATDIKTFCCQALRLAKFESDSISDDKIEVNIYTDSPTNLNQAEEELSQLKSKIIETVEIQDDCLSEFVDCDYFDIYQLAIKNKIAVTINEKAAKITLKGCSKNVQKVNEEIRTIFFELRKAISLSKQVIWKWTITFNTYIELPLRISGEVEMSHQTQKNGSNSLSMFNCKLAINLSKMTFVFNQIDGKLKRESRGDVHVPGEWVDMQGKPWTKVTLDPASQEYAKVLRLFRASDPSFNSIVRIERIQNPSLYKQFLIKKDEVERHMTTNNPVERDLFHGTSPTDAQKICADGFDRSFAGKNATKYGRGCYFALRSSYSERYCARQIKTGTKYMFVAKVLTGDYCLGNETMVAPLDKPNSGEIARKYDSTVNNAEDPSIFVVFKDSSVYPNYLITFT